METKNVYFFTMQAFTIVTPPSFRRSDDGQEEDEEDEESDSMIASETRRSLQKYKL